MIIQKKIAQNSLQYLEEHYKDELSHNQHMNNLHARLKLDSAFYHKVVENTENSKGTAIKNYQSVYLELLEQQRKLLNAMNQRAEFDEELIRKYLSIIDLEEYKMREKGMAMKNDE